MLAGMVGYPRVYIQQGTLASTALRVLYSSHRRAGNTALCVLLLLIEEPATLLCACFLPSSKSRQHCSARSLLPHRRAGNTALRVSSSLIEEPATLLCAECSPCRQMCKRGNNSAQSLPPSSGEKRQHLCASSLRFPAGYSKKALPSDLPKVGLILE